MKDDFFKIGGRYRNRIGWYEVIDAKPDKVKIKYENDGSEIWLDDLKILKRIWDNVQLEESILTPHQDERSNKLFFKTLGYLVNHSFIEAIIPPKSKDGFDDNYCRIKGEYPACNQEGYYIHHDISVDKWGVEMRLTFERTEEELNFGGNYNIVNSPDIQKLRINSNKLCYDLLNRGFCLGERQNSSEIRTNIPHAHILDFEEGLSL